MGCLPLNFPVAGSITRAMNARFMKALLKHPDRYPHNLDERHPRLLERIAALWGTKQLDPFLYDLVYDTRGGRQGFPMEVMQELMFLQTLSADTQALNDEDPWGDEKDVSQAPATTTATDLQSLLERAIRDGNQLAVRRVLASGASAYRRTPSGSTPLAVACSLAHRAVAGLLIEHGADPNVADERGFTPLHWAAFKNAPELVELLVARHAEVNARSSTGATALHQAAASGNVKTIDMLLAAGARVNDADQEGATPLYRALVGGHVPAAQRLHRAGADWSASHRSGISPASLARGNERLSELLPLIGTPV